MAGETDLKTLLRSMRPILCQGEYVFCSVDREDSNYPNLNPIGTFTEAEGLSLILGREVADRAGIAYGAVFAMITLSVHSSLEAVGFLATITGKLAENGISVNPVSAYHHDHLFVLASGAAEVMELLEDMSMDGSGSR